MCSLPRKISVAVLVILFVSASSPSFTQEDEAIGFYGGPDGGPAPLEVHFHHYGDESFLKTVTHWAWDFGDGESSNEDYPTHIFEKDGTYTVTLTVTLAGGHTRTMEKRDYIRVAPGAKPTEEDAEPAACEPAEESEGEHEEEGEEESTQEDQGGGSGDGAVFIHHSCGENWLNSGLNDALLSKSYIGDRNDITYGTDIVPDRGRPGSLGSPAGDQTDMHHWILWFNDYLHGVIKHGCGAGQNRIVLFKSCFPNSHIDGAGDEPGDPFSDWKTLANYKAVYRHPQGSGKTYEHDGHAYKALQDVFAENPDTLFIAVTAPPECWQDTDAAIAANARAFNNWLTREWLPEYVRATGLHNVTVFDWYDVLASSADASSHPNQLRDEYGGGSGDSHPNETANASSTRKFAGSGDSFLDTAWNAFSTGR